jgi:hypothetical protein
VWQLRKLRATDERGNRVYEKAAADDNVRWRP